MARALRIAFTDLVSFFFFFGQPQKRLPLLQFKEDAHSTTNIFIHDNCVTYGDLPIALQQYVAIKPLGLEYRNHWDDLTWHPWADFTIPEHIKELRVRAIQLAAVMQRVVSRAFVDICAGRPTIDSAGAPEERLAQSLSRSMALLVQWHLQNAPKTLWSSSTADLADLREGRWLESSQSTRGSTPTTSPTSLASSASCSPSPVLAASSPSTRHPLL